eukprot:UN03225
MSSCIVASTSTLMTVWFEETSQYDPRALHS